jgi:hypothetical protein
MSWKKFFKPTASKIIICILLIIFIITLWVSLYAITNYRPTAPVSPELYCRDLYNTTVDINSCIREFQLETQNEQLLVKIEMIIILLISYLISCSIIWIYNKVKK